MDQATIAVGLIGYGLGGRAFHAPFIAATPGMRLAAVVSRDPAKVHADLPGTTVVPDVATLLADGAIDLVVVSSPDHLHVEHALAAIDAGKHVLVDKPFAPTLAEARRVAERAAAAGKLLTIFHNRRWDADFRTLRRLIDEGTLGEIVQFESHFDRWKPALAGVWKETRPGGTWLDLGPHLVDQAIRLFGMPEAVFCDVAAQREGASAPDYFHALLRYGRRRMLLHSSKLTSAWSLRFAVHGTGGSYIKHGTDPQEAQAVAGIRPGAPEWGVDPRPGMLIRAGGDGSEEIANERGDLAPFWIALAAAIRGDGPNPVPPEQALQVMEVLDAGLRSAAQGREITPGSVTETR